MHTTQNQSSLKDTLAQFTGTEHYYNYTIFNLRAVLTDGRASFG